jgi:ADP-heptose:LPS heptosyltransferase
MPKFLVIRFSSIGDIVLTSPVVRCLKQQLPDTEVHFLVKSKFRATVDHNPFIDRVHVLAHSRELMVEELRSENYDFIIDLHHNARTIMVKSALRKPAYSFHKLNIPKYIYTAFKINILPNAHIVDRYMSTVSHFGVKNDGVGLNYFIGPGDETNKQDIPAAHSAGYIACVIGAAHGTKRWPVHKWKSFCHKVKYPVILLGDETDAVRGQEIASVDAVKVYNACGKFSLNESADLVHKAKLVVTNDTGLMHIAAAYKRPIISLWGNTVPSFGMTPYYGSQLVPSSILQVNKLWCRPCSKIGYEKCPLKHFKCMEHIDVDMVVSMAEDTLFGNSLHQH